MSESTIKTGIIYCRVSSKEQVDNTSLESQKHYCQEYADKNNIRVLKVFVEKGESAKTTNRTEFQNAIKFCSEKKGKVNVFIVYKIDRFARNTEDHITMRALLRRFDTELRSTTERITEDPVGKALEGMISVFSEFDNNVRTERTKNGMIERIKQGVWVWQAPIGYYRPYKGSNITPEAKNALYIKLIFEEYAKGIHSYDSLAKFIAKRGFITKNGKLPFAQLIEKMIKNPIYYGIIEVWGMRIKGSFDPIIDEDLFNRCQAGYKNKSRFEKRAVSNPDFPLRRALCSACNTSITGSHSTGRKGVKYPYYHHQKQDCPNAKFIPKETFEQLFVEYLNEITPSAKYEKIFKEIMLDIWKSNYKKFDEQNKQIHTEIENLTQERQHVFELHIRGSFTEEEFNEQKDIINEKIYAKRQLLQENHIEEFDMEEALDYCFKFVRATAKTWVRLLYQNKIRFQNIIFEEKMNFDGKKFGTAKLSSVYAINKEYGGKKSNLVALTGIEPVFTH